MKIKTFITLFILALFITALATEDADARKRRRSSSSALTGPCSEGSIELNSQFNLIYNTSEDLVSQDSETDIILNQQTAVWYDPMPYLNFNYYIADSFHLGGAIIFNGAAADYFGLDLRVGYALPLSGNFLDITGHFGYGSFSDRADGLSVMSFGAEVLFKFMIARNVSLNFGLEFKHISPDDDYEIHDDHNGSTIAVPVGVSVYF